MANEKRAGFPKFYHFLGRAVASLYLGALCISAMPVVVQTPRPFNTANAVQVGPLEIASNGLVYVKVPNAFIEIALLELNNPNLKAPDYFGEGKVGAHITAITPKEGANRHLFLPQLKQPVVYAISHLAYVKVDQKKIYYLKVLAPQLELIRLLNGLPAKIQYQDFHITVAIEE